MAMGREDLLEPKRHQSPSPIIAGVFLKGGSKLTYREATPGPPIHDLFSTRSMPFTMAMSSVLPITLLSSSPPSRPGARAALLGCL
jgi:hypothetical protein